MDFKKLFKNKFIIVLLIVLLLIIISAILTYLNGIFYAITALLSSIFCFVVTAMYVNKYINIKNNNTSELVPLTENEQTKFNKSLNQDKRFTIIKLATFLIIGLTFLILAVQMF